MSKNNLGVRFSGIREIKFSSNKKDLLELHEDRSGRDEEIIISSSINFNTSEKDKKLTIILKFVFEIEGRIKNENIEVLSLITETDFIFNTIKDNEFYLKNDGFKIPDQELSKLLQLAIGAIRGIIAIRTEGWPLEMHIPILSDKQILPI